MRGALDEMLKNFFLIIGVRMGNNFRKNLQQKVPEPLKREEEAMDGIRKNVTSVETKRHLSP